MVIGCERYEDNLGGFREVFGDKTKIQFPPFFGSDSLLGGSGRLSTIFHENLRGLADFNNSFPFGLNIPRRKND